MTDLTMEEWVATHSKAARHGHKVGTTCLACYREEKVRTSVLERWMRETPVPKFKYHFFNTNSTDTETDQ